MFTCVLGRFVASTVLSVPKPFRGALTASLDSCAEINPLDSGVTKSGRVWSSKLRCRKAMLGVWRKVPESDARSVEQGAGKRCSERGGRCRKAMLRAWRKVPESDARSVYQLYKNDRYAVPLCVRACRSREPTEKITKMKQTRVVSLTHFRR